MRRCHYYFALCACLSFTASGCYMPRNAQAPLESRRAHNARDTAARTPENSASRAGSAFATGQPQQTAAKPQTTAVDQTPVAKENPKSNAQPIAAEEAELTKLMAELTKANNIDEAARERLLTDLKKTPREQWPMLVDMFRAGLEYQQKEKAAEAVKDFVVIEPSPDKPRANPIRDTAKPTEVAKAARVAPVEAATEPIAKSLAEPAPQDSLALSTRNVLRSEGASGSDPIAERNPIRPAAYTGADQPPRDPPSGARKDGVQLATAVAEPPRSQFAQPSSWRDSLADTIAQLEANSTDSATQHDPTTQARLRLLYLVADRRNDAGREIPGVSDDAKSYWSEQLYTLGLYLDDENTPDARQRATRAAHHARNAAYRLGQLGNLIVRNMTMTTAVYSYGVYDELREYRVAPGQEVIVYAELENFTSEETAKGYHTSLKANYELLDRHGKQVAAETLGDSEEYCRNLRRDFFVAYSITIPGDLFNGDEYTLRLNIEDAKSRRVGESIAKFRVQK